MFRFIPVLASQTMTSLQILIKSLAFLLKVHQNHDADISGFSNKQNKATIVNVLLPFARINLIVCIFTGSSHAQIFVLLYIGFIISCYQIIEVHIKPAAPCYLFSDFFHFVTDFLLHINYIL